MITFNNNANHLFCVWLSSLSSDHHKILCPIKFQEGDDHIQLSCDSPNFYASLQIFILLIATAILDVTSVAGGNQPLAIFILS